MTLWPQIPRAPRCPICGAEACYFNEYARVWRCHCTPMCIEWNEMAYKPNNMRYQRTRSVFESFRRFRCNQGYGWSWFPESRPSV